MPVWIKWILDYAWGKIVPELVKWAKNRFGSAKIDKEVNAETDELLALREEANAFFIANPGVPLPKDLEDRLRAAAARRAGGL